MFTSVLVFTSTGTYNRKLYGGFDSVLCCLWCVNGIYGWLVGQETIKFFEQTWSFNMEWLFGQSDRVFFFFRLLLVWVSEPEWLFIPRVVQQLPQDIYSLQEVYQFGSCVGHGIWLYCWRWLCQCCWSLHGKNPLKANACSCQCNVLHFLGGRQ